MTTYRQITLMLTLLLSIRMLAQEKNITLKKPVIANSENRAYPASNVVDGKITRASRWMSGNVRPPHVLEIDLQKYCTISRIVVHTGIPDAEKTVDESKQAAGFWSAKNFKLQYWDDANWTDISNTEVHENRLNDVPFQFLPAFNTFKLRFICDDGEPINITEIEVFGTETDRKASGNTTSLQKKSEISSDQKINIKILNSIVGKSMKYVGYNQGYYMPGSNASGWVEYSGVNSFRVWTSLNSYVPVTTVEVDKNITTVEEFDKRKSALRSSPEKNGFIQWDKLLPLYAATEKAVSTNPMVLNYILAELKRLHVDPILQINNTDFNDTWSNKWQQWQRFYALAYYAAKTGEVTMFAMQNEPNHRASGPMKLDQWISGMQIVSDAVTSAIEDVNKNYGKHLKGRLVGPVTAGNNPEWWAAVAKNLRTDYHGKPIDENLLGIFSTHSYNSPAAGYEQRVADIRQLLAQNQPDHKALPIVYTEIGRWMNAYLIDKEETMDSPSLFTEWAGIYSNNTKNSAYGMWAFKFSNTVSETYSGGVKSGHHLTWQGKRIVEDAYINLAKNSSVTTNDKDANWPARNIVDGDKSDKSAWHSSPSNTPKWVTINLASSRTLGSAVIYTGSASGEYTAPDRVRNFSLQYLSGTEWKDIPGCNEKGNKYAQVFEIFTQPVTTSKLRFISTDSGMIKVREIKVFDVKDGPDTGKVNYDVSGIQRTGEVVRLFAKGFKNERPLFQTEISVKDENLDAITSFDSLSGNYFVWLVQRGKNNDEITLDFSGLNISAGSPVTAECVSPNDYGEVTGLINMPANQQIHFQLRPESVVLLTIPKQKLYSKIVPLRSGAMVSGGSNTGKNSQGKSLQVMLDASRPENNKLVFLRFDLAAMRTSQIQKVLLRLTGNVDKGERPYRLHVYGIPGAKWSQSDLTWKNAPLLDTKEALIKEVGRKSFVAGEIAFTKTKREHMLDVTDLVKKHFEEAITFVLVRETRQLGDDEDKGRSVLLTSSGSKKSAQLDVYYSN